MADHAGLDDEAGPLYETESSRALVIEGMALVEAADAAGVTLRLLGGVGVVLHCPGLDGVPHRLIHDIDAAIPAKEGKRLQAVLCERGYEPEARFNALHGDTRLIFHGPHGKLDVFVDRFAMCHQFDLGSRLALEYPTITVSDLLATKLQVVELSTQDIEDLTLLLGEHELGEGTSDDVDVAYLSQLLAGDWGFWRSATNALRRLADDIPSTQPKATALVAAFERAPKSRRWKLRARIGERIPWYETPGDAA
jgi:hypothetical protein